MAALRGHRQARRLLALLLLGALALRATPALAEERGELVIFAAASLQEAFAALALRFEAAHGVRVKLSFAGSQELRTQLEQGAQADLFAAADTAHAQALHAEKLGDEPQIFAGNALVIAVPRGNPARVAALRDLALLRHLVVAEPEVPAGAAARKLWALADAAEPGLAARLEQRVASREPDVRLVLAKVALGEADAGLVYRTDARAMADRVDAIELPAALAVRTRDALEVLTGARHRAQAVAFAAFVLSPEGQRELSARGFLPPGAP